MGGDDGLAVGDLVAWRDEPRAGGGPVARGRVVGREGGMPLVRWSHRPGGPYPVADAGRIRRVAPAPAAVFLTPRAVLRALGEPEEIAGDATVWRGRLAVPAPRGEEDVWWGGVDGGMDRVELWLVEVTDGRAPDGMRGARVLATMGANGGADEQGPPLCEARRRAGDAVGPGDYITDGQDWCRGRVGTPVGVVVGEAVVGGRLRVPVWVVRTADGTLAVIGKEDAVRLGGDG